MKPTHKFQPLKTTQGIFYSQHSYSIRNFIKSLAEANNFINEVLIVVPHKHGAGLSPQGSRRAAKDQPLLGAGKSPPFRLPKEKLPRQSLFEMLAIFLHSFHRSDRTIKYYPLHTCWFNIIVVFQQTTPDFRVVRKHAWVMAHSFETSTAS
jgi:hypothetical protein